MRLATPLAALLLLLAACADPAGPGMPAGLADESAPTPSAQATTSRDVVTIPIVDLVTPSLCGGEDFILNGEITYAVTEVVTATGERKVSIHQSGHASGATASGTLYQAILNEHLTSEQIGVCSTSLDCTLTTTIKFVGQGGAPDLTMRSVTKFNRDADGDLVANVQQSEMVCH